MSSFRDSFRKNHVVGPPERTLAVSSGLRSLYVIARGSGDRQRSAKSGLIPTRWSSCAKNKRRVIALSNDVNENSGHDRRLAPVQAKLDSGCQGESEMFCRRRTLRAGGPEKSIAPARTSHEIVSLLIPLTPIGKAHLTAPFLTCKVDGKQEKMSWTTQRGCSGETHEFKIRSAAPTT
jgi:hypothetical protein